MGHEKGNKAGRGATLGVIATIIVACIGLVGTITVAYFQFILQPSISLKATQTAEGLKIAQTIAALQTPLPANTESIIPQTSPELTNTPIPTFTPSITPSITPSHTPTPSLTPTPTAELISRRLLRWSGGFMPDLAVAWEFSDDGRYVTFFLEDNVLLADGSPFNADVASEEIISTLGQGTNIDILNDLTLKLDFGIVSASLSSDIMELISTIDFIVRK